VTGLLSSLLALSVSRPAPAVEGLPREGLCCRCGQSCPGERSRAVFRRVHGLSQLLVVGWSSELQLVRPIEPTSPPTAAHPSHVPLGRVSGRPPATTRSTGCQTLTGALLFCSIGHLAGKRRPSLDRGSAILASHSKMMKVVDQVHRAPMSESRRCRSIAEPNAISAAADEQDFPTSSSTLVANDRHLGSPPLEPGDRRRPP
jgi:hypothetical protein